MKIATNLVLWGIGSCFPGFISCNIINPDEDIPAYLRVDTFTFSAGAGQGSASTRITDIWVYDEQQLQGTYEMPITFPILHEGPETITLVAGIQDNGISTTRVPYPFYFPDTTTLNLMPAQVIALEPHFTYRTGTVFHFIEDFEAGNIFLKTFGDTDIVRTKNLAEVFEGVTSAAIYLDQEHQVYEGRTINAYALPTNQPVYLELNYRCDQPFEVGLYGTQFGAGIFYYKWNINTKPTWNKIYLNLGYDVAALGADEYQILIRTVLDESRTSSNIYLDNIKLVSF